jgi:LytR cell envelope-related transcriptional attenuator
MAALAHEIISGKTLSSPATLDRLQQAIQRTVVISDGWDVMDLIKQLQKLSAGNVAFATIPVLDESGWSDDGMQSVVRVDQSRVQAWVKGLLDDQSKGKTQQLAYTPVKTTVDVINDTNIDGLAAAVSQALAAKGFTAGKTGNNDTGHVSNSQVQATATDDPGAQAVSVALGNLPVVVSRSVAPATVRVMLSSDYTGPGSGLDGPSATTATVETASALPDSDTPAPSPVITAGSNDPECVN